MPVIRTVARRQPINAKSDGGAVVVLAPAHARQRYVCRRLAEFFRVVRGRPRAPLTARRRPLLGVGAMQVVRARETAVFPDPVRAGRPDHDGIMREVELDRRAPGIDDLALVVFLCAGGGVDDHLAALSLTGEGLRYFRRGSRRIMLEELLVLLEPLDQAVRVGLEFGDF